MLLELSWIKQLTMHSKSLFFTANTLGNDNGASYGDKCVHTFTRYQRQGKKGEEKRQKKKKRKQQISSYSVQRNNVDGWS